MKVKEHELSRLAYDLRKDVVNMIMAGNGGHIGGDMSVMETLVTLYFRPDAYRFCGKYDMIRIVIMFVLSKGHAVGSLLCSTGQKRISRILMKVIHAIFSQFGSAYHRTSEQSSCRGLR